MRTFTARRRKRGAPVPFVVDYVEEVAVQTTLTVTDRATGEKVEQPTTQKVEQPRSEEFICVGEISALAISELAYNGVLEIDTPEAMMIFREIMFGAFGDEAEYRRFFRFSQAYLDTDDLMDILGGLVEDFAARPTQPSSDSPDVPSTSGDDSKVVSLAGGYKVASAS